MNKPIIREYKLADKAACLHIFDSNMPQYFMSHERAEFEEWLDKTDRAPYYVLLQQDKVVANGGIYKDDDLKIVGMAWGMVENSLHKNGYGKFLTLHRIEVMHTLYPDLEKHLQTSQHTVAFYEKLGFQTLEVIKNGFGEGMDKYEMYLPTPKT